MKIERMKYNLIYKLLGIDTNIKYIPYFHYSPALSKIIKGKPEIEIGYYVEKDIKKPEDLSKKFDFCWANVNSSIIYYEHPLILGLKAKILLDLTKNKNSITVNCIYNKIVKFKFDNVWSPGQHFSNLVTINLLQKNIATLHCASFSNKETQDGYLIFGASNTGKSYTTFKALKDGYQYHSEDLTIIDKNTIYSIPSISANSDKLPDKDFLLKLHLFFLSIPVVNLIAPRFHTIKSYEKFAQNINYKSVGKLSKIFILERGNKNIKKLSNKEAFRRILILNRIELAYYNDHLYRSYSYFNKKIDIEKLYKKEEELIKYFTENAETFLISENYPEKFYPHIKKIISE